MLRKKQIVIYIFIYLYIFLPRITHGAVLYSQSANQDVYQGQTFVLDWYLDTENQAINTVDLGLSFSQQTLEVSEITLGNSLINLWIKTPAADNLNGNINLVGGISNGVVGPKVPVFRIVFKAKTSGTAFISLDPNSQVLLNDGKGTATALKFRNEAFNVYPKDFIPLQINSSSHPSLDLWYRNRDVSITFEKKEGLDYSYSFSSNIDIAPDNIQMDVPAQIMYPNLPDAIYYFKVNSKQGPGNWQEAAVRRVQIDGTAPEEFTPIIGFDSGVKSGNRFVSFSTLDKTSGISHYKVKLGLLKSVETKDSVYTLPKFVVGKKITVIAYDNAGNKRSETIDYDGGIALIWFYGLLVVVPMAILFINPKTRRRFSKIQTKDNEENIS